MAKHNIWEKEKNLENAKKAVATFKRKLSVEVLKDLRVDHVKIEKSRLSLFYFSFSFSFSFQFIFLFLFLELRVRVKTHEHKKKDMEG